MVKKPEKSSTIFLQIWHFVLHLRWHYQLFILSGGFLLGGLLSESLNFQNFLLQFLNVHLLLFGGATAYNSYWDKDEGPIGGLKNPPKMRYWMWAASLLLQLAGLLIALPAGTLFVGIYVLSMLLFWLYSTPYARWKSLPVKSLFAIGISTGFDAVIMGFLAAGNTEPTISIIAAAIGVSCILLSLYPISQIYQLDEDVKRGDTTFAVHYGVHTVVFFFDIMYFIGLGLITIILITEYLGTGTIFGALGLITGLIIRKMLRTLKAQKEEYDMVMWIKYGTSMAFVSFILLALFLKHIK